MSVPAERKRLAILDGYGVRWSRLTFARDILQNFFDAAPDLGQVAIAIDAVAATVEVRGPTTFDLDLLAYVGATTKNDGSTAGGFGEGFKVCALVGVRDFGLAIAAGSGGLALEVVLDPVPLGRELCYDVRRLDPPEKGSWVRLTGCDRATIEAFDEARFFFRDPSNPKLGPVIAETPDGRIAILRGAIAGEGEIYYRRQHRGTVRCNFRDCTISICHDPPIAELDGDRDRRDLQAATVAIAIAAALPDAELGKAIFALERYWECGHDVLQPLIAAATERGLKFVFPPGWIAKTGERGKGSRDALAERIGLKLALASFAAIGMARASVRITGGLETRAPTDLERARLAVTADLYCSLAARPTKIKMFEVFDDVHAAVSGQHLGDRVLVSARQIAAGFDEVAATVLHELSHEAGGEEADPFLGRLRTLIAAVIADPATVQAARTRYAEVTADDAPASLTPAPPPSAHVVPEAYSPERAMNHQDGRLGLTLVAWVPPGFPPCEELAARVREAAAQAGAPGVQVLARPIADEASAVARKLPGVPTVLVDDDDVAPDSATGPHGFYLRRYADGGCLPSVAAIAGAIARVRGRPRTRSPALPPAEARARALEAKVEGWAGFASGLGGVWTNALRRAAETRVERVQPDDPRPADAVWSAIHAELMVFVEHARAQRRADRELDDADALERDAMSAAQGLSFAAFAAFAGSLDDGRRAADEAFGRMRAITARVFDTPIEARLRPELLAYIVTGEADEFASEPSDIAELEVRAERGLEAARRITRLRADEGREAGVSRLADLLQTDGKPAFDLAAYYRQQAVRATATWGVKAAYDDAIGRGDTPFEAAAQALAAIVAQADAFKGAP